MDKRIENIAAALDGITDGASVMISGFGGAGLPVVLIRALEAASVDNLTLILNSLRFIETYAPGLFADKRVRKTVSSAARGRGKESSEYELQLEQGTLELELVPQGTFAERMRAGGAGIPAFYTPTGFGTKLTEGKETREFNGRQCVLETALTADFALMRADVADRWGNVSFRGTQANFGPAMAMASRVAVVEVERVLDEPLPPNAIDIPGIFTQRIIAVPDER
ncbi:MAG: 3-oxoacid CoA-transferase subunit A [Alphaproteobacteria bacterium]|nr:3-oxoacid CoA-transferase subunit A [Alphaproteobacteria bacterium]